MTKKKKTKFLSISLQFTKPVGTHTKNPTIKFTFLGYNKIWYILNAPCIISVSVSTKCHSLHKFIFFCSNNTFFIYHALQFKYCNECLISQK